MYSNNVFFATFDQFNMPLLNKSFNFLKTTTTPIDFLNGSVYICMYYTVFLCLLEYYKSVTRDSMTVKMLP